MMQCRSEAILTILALACAGCSDVLVQRYPSRSVAEADRAIERGWVPALLPASSTDIRECHNLDTSEVRGEFAFDAADEKALRAALGDQVSVSPKYVRPLPSCPLEWSDLATDVEAWKARSTLRGIYRPAGTAVFFYAIDWSTRHVRYWAN